MKLYIDTNIILDVIYKREPFFYYSSKIWELTEKKIIKCFISASSITDIFYIASKELGKIVAKDIIADLLNIFEISDITKDIVEKSMLSRIQDLEDAIQYVSFLKTESDYLITRNLKDFKDEKNNKIIDPESFVKKYFFQNTNEF